MRHSEKGLQQTSNLSNPPATSTYWAQEGYGFRGYVDYFTRLSPQMQEEVLLWTEFEKM